jgi:hypothetical protein
MLKILYLNKVVSSEKERTRESNPNRNEFVITIVLCVIINTSCRKERKEKKQKEKKKEILVRKTRNDTIIDMSEIGDEFT